MEQRNREEEQDERQGEPMATAMAGLKTIRADVHWLNMKEFAVHRTASDLMN